MRFLTMVGDRKVAAALKRRTLRQPVRQGPGAEAARAGPRAPTPHQHLRTTPRRGESALTPALFLHVQRSHPPPLLFLFWVGAQRSATPFFLSENATTPVRWFAKYLQRLCQRA